MSRIIFGTLRDSSLGKLENWSVVKQKWLVQTRLISKNWPGCRQAYCVAEFISKPTPKPSSSPTLCSVWENGRWSYCILEEQNEMVFGQTPTEFEWKIFTGTRENSKSTERCTVRTWARQRQGHIHVNLQWHSMGQERNRRKMWIQNTDSCELCS